MSNGKGTAHMTHTATTQIEYEIVYDRSADAYEAYAIHNGEDYEWLATCDARHKAQVYIDRHKRENRAA